jgi:hypothetical protein
MQGAGCTVRRFVILAKAVPDGVEKVAPQRGSTVFIQGQRGDDTYREAQMRRGEGVE